MKTAQPWTGVDHFGQWFEFRIGGIRHRMRWVKPGKFVMGTKPGVDDAFPDEVQRELEVQDGYWIGEIPCTQELFQAVTGDNPSCHKGSRRPVEGISWNDCKTFLAKLNEKIPGLAVRLPTEKEWEYACRAGTTSLKYGATSKVAWCSDNSDGQTQPVKLKRANAWGLYDMLGNVMEWCEDWDPLTIGPLKNSPRLVRGGSWDDESWFVRSASRFSRDPNYRGADVGVRLASDSLPQLEPCFDDPYDDEASSHTAVAASSSSISSETPHVLVDFTEVRSTVVSNWTDVEVYRASGNSEGFKAGLNHYVRFIHGSGPSPFLFELSNDLLVDVISVCMGEAGPKAAQRVARSAARFLGQAGVDVDQLRGRFTLCTDVGELRSLLLEMTESAAEPWLGLNEEVSVRYRRPKALARRRKTNKGDLLFAWSDNAGPVDHDKHIVAIKECCPEWLRFAPEPTIGVLAEVNLSTLARRLDVLEDATVLHLLCHAARGPDGTYMIEFYGRESSPKQLARVLKKYGKGVQLVILSVCHGSEILPDQSLTSFAEELHKIGVTWVVSSRGPLSLKSSIALTRTLYRGLSGGFEHMDDAVVAVRRVLEEQGAHDYEWASVQLHVAPQFDGVLYDDTPSSAPLAAAAIGGNVAFSTVTVLALGGVVVEVFVRVNGMRLLDSSWMLSSSALIVLILVSMLGIAVLIVAFVRRRRAALAPYFVGVDEIGDWMDIRIGEVVQRFRWIPAGVLTRGSRAQGEVGILRGDGVDDEVTISRGFWIAETPCTQALWVEVMGSNPSERRGRKRPVDSVTIEQVDRFIEKFNELLPGAGVRLPTEVEWEYGCKADQDGQRYGELDEIAWYEKNSGERTQAVRQKRPNAWGLYDMIGNVWELCADERVEGALRVERGGSSYSNGALCTAIHHRARSLEGKNIDSGFRLARDQMVFSRLGRDSSSQG